MPVHESRSRSTITAAADELSAFLDSYPRNGGSKDILGYSLGVQSALRDREVTKRKDLFTAALIDCHFLGVPLAARIDEIQDIGASARNLCEPATRMKETRWRDNFRNTVSSFGGPLANQQVLMKGAFSIEDGVATYTPVVQGIIEKIVAKETEVPVGCPAGLNRMADALCLYVEVIR